MAATDAYALRHMGQNRLRALRDIREGLQARETKVPALHDMVGPEDTIWAAL